MPASTIAGEKPAASAYSVRKARRTGESGSRQLSRTEARASRVWAAGRWRSRWPASRSRCSAARISSGAHGRRPSLGLPRLARGALRNISSAAMEQPRASAPGFPSQHLEAIPQRAPEVCALDGEHAPRVGQVENRHDADLAVGRFVAALRIDEPHPRPGRSQLAPRRAREAQHRVVELAAELGHAVLVDDSFGRDAEGAMQAPVEQRPAAAPGRAP